jgi:hypothetical protein
MATAVTSKSGVTVTVLPDMATDCATRKFTSNEVVVRGESDGLRRGQRRRDNVNRLGCGVDVGHLRIRVGEGHADVGILGNRWAEKGLLNCIQMGRLKSNP